MSAEHFIDFSKSVLKSSDREHTSAQMDVIQSPQPISSGDVSFLRLPEVKRLTGLSKSTLYAMIRAKSFPAPVPLGPRTVAWVRSEVKEWAAERISISRAATSNLSGGLMPQRAVGEGWTPPNKYA